MDDARLQAIRRKVEAGDRLSDEELERLRAAAQAQPGPTLRLAVAHALINNGDDRTALALLENLVRDFPRDLQSWLGLGRALLSLDRPQEAERALKEALSLSPQDAEAQKVMAVLALRRGEHARARQWVTDVLRRDPFDSEAKLILAELEAPGELPPEEGGAAGTPIALRPEFTRALLRVLRQRNVQASAKEDAILLRRETGEVVRVDVRSLYAAYLAQHRPLEEAVRSLADGLNAAALGVPEGKAGLLAQVLPVLRPASFADVAPGAARREGPAGLLVFYVIEDPELVRYVPAGSLEARGLSVDEVDRAAWANLSRRPSQPRRVAIDGTGSLVAADVGPRLWALAEEDGHDGARLLTQAQQELLTREVGPGPWRVSLGLREAAVLCREADDDARAALERLSPSPDGISGSFVLEKRGQATFFVPAVAGQRERKK